MIAIVTLRSARRHDLSGTGTAALRSHDHATLACAAAGRLASACGLVSASCVADVSLCAVPLLSGTPL